MTEETIPDIRVKLSTMWIVVMMNMIFADIFSIVIQLADKGAWELPGDARTTMAVAAVATNIPILMIWLSRTLPYRFNRPANMAAGILTAIYITAGGDLSPHYLILAGIEAALLSAIIIKAWKWKQ